MQSDEMERSWEWRMASGGPGRLNTGWAADTASTYLRSRPGDSRTEQSTRETCRSRRTTESSDLPKLNEYLIAHTPGRTVCAPLDRAES